MVLARFEHITSLIIAGDPTATNLPTKAIRELRRPDECSIAVLLEARVPLPTNPATRDRVNELRARLLHVRILREAGKPGAAQTLVHELLDQARVIDYRPVTAEVLDELGTLEQWLGEPEQSEQTLRRAARLAEASRHDQLAASSWIQLVSVAQDLGDLERARDYGSQARAVLDRISFDRELESRYSLHQGMLDFRDSKMNEARQAFERSLRLTMDPETAQGARDGLAWVESSEGRYEEALAILNASLLFWEREMGPEHEDVARAHAGIAIELGRLGRNAEALEHDLQALAILESALEPGHIDLATAHHNVGEGLFTVGFYDEALIHFEEAVASLQLPRGPNHASFVQSLCSKGATLTALERAEEAIDELERALAMAYSTLGPEHADTAACHGELADALQFVKDYPAALMHDERAAQITVANGGTESYELGPYLIGMARSLVELGRPEEALAQLAHAERLFEPTELRTPEIAGYRFVLGQALWDLGKDRVRAMQLVQDARQIFTDDGPGSISDVARVDAWLVAHPFDEDLIRRTEAPR